jgi:hypothetical protein
MGLQLAGCRKLAAYMAMSTWQEVADLVDVDSMVEV